jgi:ribonuclease HII
LAKLAQFDLKKLVGRPGIVGLDEAGRGALCGSVVAAAVFLNKVFYADKKLLKRVRQANDSKKLSPEKRQELRLIIAELEAEGKIQTAWAEGSVLEIAAHNILGATRLAMSRCITQLTQGPLQDAFAHAGTEHTLFSHSHDQHLLVLVDGLPLKPFVWHHQAIKQGDGRSLAIALASIIAKVERDRLLTILHETYPDYGFAQHKGYGTPEHVAALRRLGPSPVHRHLFVQSILDGKLPPHDDQADLPFN